MLSSRWRCGFVILSACRLGQAKLKIERGAGVDEEGSWEGVIMENQKIHCHACGWHDAEAQPHTLGIGLRF